MHWWRSKKIAHCTCILIPCFLTFQIMAPPLNVVHQYLSRFSQQFYAFRDEREERKGEGKGQRQVFVKRNVRSGPHWSICGGDHSGLASTLCFMNACQYTQNPLHSTLQDTGSILGLPTNLSRRIVAAAGSVLFRVFLIGTTGPVLTANAARTS